MKINKDMAVFALILGLLGVYFSSAFIRLEVFGGIAIIILASIGASILISKILNQHRNKTKVVTKVSFLAVIVVLLTVPLVYPEEINWVSFMSKSPPTIVNGGTQFLLSSNDWSDAMHWLNVKTPEDSVVAAWWDYGYWISTLGERKTLSDNATLLDWQIKKTASMLFSPPDDAWKILNSDPQTDVSSHFISFPMTHTTATSIEERDLELFEEWQVLCLGESAILDDDTKTNDGKTRCDVDDEIVNNYPSLLEYWKDNKQLYTPTCDCFGDPSLTGMGADYVLIQIAGLMLPQDFDVTLYSFGGKGADMSKAFWMIKIADLDIRDYYNPDGKSFSDKFWNETIFGKLIPFTPFVYVNVETGEQSLTWTQNTDTAVYMQDVKYPGVDDTEEYIKSEPFQLVYVSPSVMEPIDNMIVGIFIYKVNHDYQIPNL
jgi:dolichyl-diphosphooligosaccharide--protein glycosyltransferase